MMKLLILIMIITIYLQILKKRTLLMKKILHKMYMLINLIQMYKLLKKEKTIK